MKRSERGSSNLVPAIVICVGALIGGFLAQSGGGSASDTTTETTIAEDKASGESTESTAAKDGEKDTTASSAAEEPDHAASDAEHTAGTAVASGPSATAAESGESPTTEAIATELPTGGGSGATTAEGADGAGMAGKTDVASWTEEIGRCVASTDPPPAEVTDLVTQRPVVLAVPTAADIVNDGGRLVASLKEGNTIVVGGKEWEVRFVLVQPSSHHIVDGAAAVAEVQFVARGEDGNLGVFARVAVVGAEANTVLDTVMQGYPKLGMAAIPTSVDVPGLITEAGGIGSASFDPGDGCTGPVRRGLFEAPLTISADQLAALQGLFTS